MPPLWQMVFLHTQNICIMATLLDSAQHTGLFFRAQIQHPKGIWMSAILLSYITHKNGISDGDTVDVTSQTSVVRNYND